MFSKHLLHIPDNVTVIGITSVNKTDRVSALMESAFHGRW